MGSGESKRVRAAQVQVVPSELMDQVGAPARGNERESVTVVRLPSLPGVELWRAQRSSRYWRVYHENYDFCTPDANWRAEARWRYRGRELAMNATAQQIFEPGLAHNTFHVAGPATDFQVLLIQPSKMAALLGAEPPHLAPFTDDPELQVQLWRACLAVRDGQDPLTAEAAVAEFAESTFRRLGEQPASGRVPGVTDWRVKRVHEMIHDGFEQELRLDALADGVGLSPARLVNLFRQCSGLPVHQYLIALRLAKAQRLLAQGISPSDAAIQVGFYDLRHFGRVMKQQLGFTPSHYFDAGREGQRGEPRSRRKSVLPR